MIRVLLFGAAGRMGTTACEEISRHADLMLVGGVERPDHPGIGMKIGDGVLVADGDLFPESDVWLDFSLAGPAVAHARAAASIGKAMIVAATGFGASEEEEIVWQAKLCPILLAPNLSAGIGMLENLAVAATRLIPDGFQAVMVETHHKTKKDAPSGTALRIVERMGKYGVKPEIQSIRAGGVVGEHRIQLYGAEEELIIMHRAWSRRAFSSGIPRAVRFIVRQPAGLYSLQDIFQLD